MEHQIVDLEEVLCAARNDGYRGQVVLIGGEPEPGKYDLVKRPYADQAEAPLD